MEPHWVAYVHIMESGQPTTGMLKVPIVPRACNAKRMKYASVLCPTATPHAGRGVVNNSCTFVTGGAMQFVCNYR